MNIRLILLIVGSLLVTVDAVPLRVLAWDEQVAQREVWIHHGDDSFQVTGMHPAARTKEKQLSVKEEGLFLETRDRESADGEAARTPLKIPGGINQLLLILLPDKNSETGLRPLFIEDDAGSFPWGTIRLVNSTGKLLVFRHEKRLTQLKKGWKPVEIKPGGNPRKMEVALYLPDRPKRPIYSAIWEHRNELRQLAFIVKEQDPALGPVRVKFIVENRNVKRVEAAGHESPEP